jgi:pheromone shutdown protein TraB
MASLKVGNCDILLLGTIKGLEKESDRVREGFDSMKPELIAVSLSKEDLGILADFSGENEKAKPMNFEEEVYIRELQRFGDVLKPPPCYLSAVKLGKKHGIPCTPLDMNDEEYTEAFCRNVSTFELYRHSWSAKKLRKRKFMASTPEQFVREFDSTVTRLDGYSKLEEERERFIAKKLKGLSTKRESILAVIELERADGVTKLLTQK